MEEKLCKHGVIGNQFLGDNCPMCIEQKNKEDLTRKALRETLKKMEMEIETTI